TRRPAPADADGSGSTTRRLMSPESDWPEGPSRRPVAVVESDEPEGATATAGNGNERPSARSELLGPAVAEPESPPLTGSSRSEASDAWESDGDDDAGGVATEPDEDLPRPSGFDDDRDVLD